MKARWALTTRKSRSALAIWAFYGKTSAILLALANASSARYASAVSSWETITRRRSWRAKNWNRLSKQIR